MKRISLLKTMVVAMFVFANFFGISSFAGTPPKSLSLPQNCNVLFVQVAKSGQLVPSKTQPNTYQLTLKMVEPFTSFFTDRPNRVTGLLNTSTFVGIWQNELDIRQTPPNVAMETSNVKNSQRVTQVLELSNPVYDNKNHQITYVAKPLNGATLSPMTLGYTVLFIDDFNWHGNKFG